MALSRSLAVFVLIAGTLAGLIIVAGFIAPTWTFEMIGVIPFILAVIVELGCAVVANTHDVLGALR